jgi:hypothetical protein
MFQPSDATMSLQLAEAGPSPTGPFSSATTAVTHKAGKSGMLSLSDHWELRQRRRDGPAVGQYDP